MELTKDNLEKELSGFYRSRFLDMQGKSETYKKFVRECKERNGREPSTVEKTEKIREIVEDLLSKSLSIAFGVTPDMYQIQHSDVEVAQDNRIHAKSNNKISINNNVVNMLQQKSQEKIERGGFNYW